MSRLDVIRAWKDPEYRLTLTKEKCAQQTARVIEVMEATNPEFDSVVGGVCQPCHVPIPTLLDSGYNFSPYENIGREPYAQYYDYDAGICKNPYNEATQTCGG